MFNSELNSFLVKFHQLREAGKTAHLDLDTFAGKAWVGIRVMLDDVSVHHQQQQGRRRSPAYFRRQERRKAAARAAEGGESRDVGGAPTEKSTEEVESDITSHKSNADEAILSFDCELCDFKSNREAGVTIHMTRKHASIEQLDGNTEEEVLDELETEWDDEIDYYLETGEFKNIHRKIWDDILYYLGRNEQGIDLMHWKKNREEKILALEARKRAIDRECGLGEYLNRYPWYRSLYRDREIRDEIGSG